MKVLDTMKQIYGNEVYTAAYMMDEAGAAKIEAAYQSEWDSGNGFTLPTIFSGRKEDSEEEKKACASQMMNAFNALVVKKWLSRYTRDEIVALCNLLLKGPNKRYTRVRLVADLEMDADDIAREWSNLHQNEGAIYLLDPDIG